MPETITRTTVDRAIERRVSWASGPLRNEWGGSDYALRGLPEHRTLRVCAVDGSLDHGVDIFVLEGRGQTVAKSASLRGVGSDMIAAVCDALARDR